MLEQFSRSDIKGLYAAMKRGSLFAERIVEELKALEE